MRALTPDEANTYLLNVGMQIGGWSQLEDIDVKRRERRSWVHRLMPPEARIAYIFSQHIAGWLPPGKWKLLQIDNSNTLNPVQSSMATCLLAGPASKLNLFSQRSFLFEFGGDIESDSDAELIICNLIFALLLFGGFAQIVSSSGNGERYISIHDGFAYLMSVNDTDDATRLISEFERTGGSPDWISEIFTRRQEKSLG